MGSYRLTQAAKEDLRQIYFYGFEIWGEATADRYYSADHVNEKMDLADAVGAGGGHCGKLSWVC